MGLEEKVAVVTGSATGVGRGIAVALAEVGIKVMVTYNKTNADETMALIRKCNGEAHLIQLDVSRRESIRNLMKETEKVFGKIDILVNCAAVQLNKYLSEYTEDEYDRIMKVNLQGYWRCIQEVLPYMKKQKNGRIINTSSIHAKRPTGFDVIYSMTKGGIKMLTREAALALARYGITVNTISPGSVEIGGNSSKLPIVKNLTVKGLNFKNKPASGFLTGNMGQMRDIGYIAVFLADDRSAYITGSSFRSDGGAMMI